MARPVLQMRDAILTDSILDASGSERWTTRSAWQANSASARVAAVLTLVVLTAGVALGQTGIASAFGVATMLPAALVDIVERRLPDRLVRAAAAVLAGAHLASQMLADHESWPDLAAPMLGAGTMAGPLLVLHLVSPGSMGFGDVKSSLVLGAALGIVHPQLPLVALLIASGTTALVGVLTRRRSLPFGPGLVGGSAIALAMSDVWIGAVA